MYCKTGCKMVRSEKLKCKILNKLRRDIKNNSSFHLLKRNENRNCLISLVERSAKNRASSEEGSTIFLHAYKVDCVRRNTTQPAIMPLGRMWINALISGITREISPGRQLDVSSISFWIVIIQYAIVFIRLSTWRALCQSRYRKLFALIVISAARRYVWRNPYYPEAQMEINVIFTWNAPRRNLAAVRKYKQTLRNILMPRQKTDIIFFKSTF